MASIIQELQKKQAGFYAAQKAIEETKPKSVEFEKRDDSGNITKASYRPGDDIFYFEFFRSDRYHQSISVKSPEAKLLLEILNMFFTEAANAS